MKKSFLLFLVILLTACSVFGQSDLDRNRQKWEDAKIEHYRFSLNIGCFCAFRSEMPLSVEVSNGEIVSMNGADGNPITSSNSNHEYYSSYATFDRLFSELETDLAGEADEVTVTYDATHGFPTQISIDFIKEAIDDELYITVSEFEALP